MNLIAVPPDRAKDAWPLAERFISSACERTGFAELADVQTQIMSGTALLWLAAEDTQVSGAGVTKLIEICGAKACEIFVWAADDHEKCAPLLKTIEEYAKNEGCATVRLAGRKGWARQLPDYRLAAIILEKAV